MEGQDGIVSLPISTGGGGKAAMFGIELFASEIEYRSSVKLVPDLAEKSLGRSKSEGITGP